MKPSLIALLLATSTWLAHAAPATTESVEALLLLTKAQEMVESASTSVEGSVRQGMRAAISNKDLSAEQKQQLDAVPAKLVAAMQPEFSWAVLKPDFVRLYVETFNQDEVDGMIAFYQGPIGQALIAKMPQILNRSMQLTQARLGAAMPRLQAAMAAAMADLQAKR